MNICNEVVSRIRQQLEYIISLRARKFKKEDGSFVSDGDLLVEGIVLNYIHDNLPSHEVISEEINYSGRTNWDSTGSYVVLDPIDGTENFVSGLREWGIGISIYTNGKHEQSCIYLPELHDVQITGMPIKRYQSRIYGLSSSLNKQDLMSLPEDGLEYRIMGCSMYNTLSAARGAFVVFENVKGVNCWDILPGLNLALEHGCKVSVDGAPYLGQILFPLKKYRIKISNL